VSDSSQPINPFVFDAPVTPAELVGRERELAQFQEMACGKGRVMLEGPHRHGKTSLLWAAADRWRGTTNALAVRIDLAGILTEQEAVDRIQSAMVQAQVAPGDRSAPLREVLEAFARIAKDRGQDALVCFDEFHDAVAVPDLVKWIDSYAERHRQHLACALAGIDLTALLGLSTEDADATVIHVGRLDRDLLAAAIISKFEGTGRDAGDAAWIVASTGAGHPQRTSLLAWHLWERTSIGARADVAEAEAAVDAALRQCTPEFESGWRALHGNERRVAVAIANELAPQGTRALRATGLAGFGAAQRALKGLQTRDIAFARVDGSVGITDPLCAWWPHREHPLAAQEPDWRALQSQRQRLELEQRRGLKRG
jgi:uncharacterized protein